MIKKILPISLQREWPTLLLIAVFYGLYALLILSNEYLGQVTTFVLLSCAITLHSSLQHEVIHGHPFANSQWNTLLVLPPVGLFIPYHRFRDTHLKHHQDENLTDPYDDPETAYLEVQVWQKLPFAVRCILLFNNTLSGRMLIGPLVSMCFFYSSDWKYIRRGNKRILHAYLIHICVVICLLYCLVAYAEISLTLYVLSAYCGFSLLKIRTFLEHQAKESAAGRTAVVDDQGLLGWLFLFNNYHSVHHQKPGLPWYRLPGEFRANRSYWLSRNQHYYYESYWSVIKQYLFVAKEGVAHPFWSLKNRTAPHSRDDC